MSKSSRASYKRVEFKDVRRSYWRQQVRYWEGTDVYSQENINRMKRGQPPRRLAVIRNKKTQETIEFHAPVELHHIFPLNGDAPIDSQAFIELYPWQHASVDDSRKFNWEFVEWRSFR